MAANIVTCVDKSHKNFNIKLLRSIYISRHIAISAPKLNNTIIKEWYGIRMGLSWARIVIKRLGLKLRLRLDI